MLLDAALKQARQERQERLYNRNQLYRYLEADEDPLLDDSSRELTKRRYLKSK